MGAIVEFIETKGISLAATPGAQFKPSLRSDLFRRPRFSRSSGHVPDRIDRKLRLRHTTPATSFAQRPSRCKGSVVLLRLDVRRASR